MLTQPVSLILIAAVFACPLSCGNGLCQADHQCCADDAGNAGDASTLQTCPVQVTSDCCGESSHAAVPPAPHPCPRRSICQGICGGAVLERPAELEDTELPSFLPQPAIDMLDSVALAPGTVDSCVFPNCVGARNQGRFVRILHNSFLC